MYSFHDIKHDKNALMISYIMHKIIFLIGTHFYGAWSKSNSAICHENKVVHKTKNVQWVNLKLKLI